MLTLILCSTETHGSCRDKSIHYHKIEKIGLKLRVTYIGGLRDDFAHNDVYRVF